MYVCSFLPFILPYRLTLKRNHILKLIYYIHASVGLIVLIFER